MLRKGRRETYSTAAVDASSVYPAKKMRLDFEGFIDNENWPSCKLNFVECLPSVWQDAFYN